MISEITGGLWHHRLDECESGLDGSHCVFHNPSEHPLKGAPLSWRGDRGLMERICQHNIGHPDPDDLNFFEKANGQEAAEGRGIHGCCGCCVGEEL